MAGTKVEVYGFAGWVTSFVAYGVYLLWAYLPNQFLHQIGINYFPNKYWAVAIPTYLGVFFVLFMIMYLSLNFLQTPTLDSLSTITDEYAREASEDELNTPGDLRIPPISDISIDTVNRYLYLRSQ